MCVITIDRAIADRISGSTIERILISGTVRDCPPPDPPIRDIPFEIFIHVTTTVLVNGQPDPNQSNPTTVEVDSSGNWHTHAKGLTFPCNSEIRVRTECHTDPTCFLEQDFTVNCDCPTAVLTAAVAPNCNTNNSNERDGTRTVTFSIDLTNLTANSPLFGEIHLGSGVPAPGLLPVMFDPTSPGPEWSADTDGFVGTFSFDYQPGTYDDVFFEIIFPSTCSVSFPMADAPLEISDCVAENCPGDTDVVIEVLDAISFFPVAVGEDDPCLPAGQYILVVTEPTPTDGRDYTWFVDTQEATGPNDNGWNRNMFRHTIGAGSSPSIHVEISTPNCDPARSEAVVLRACGTTTEPPPPPQPPDWCLIWFWINVALMIVTGVVIVAAFCMIDAAAWSAILALASGGTLAAVWAALSASAIAALILSLVLVVVTLASFIFWLSLCAPGRADACSLIATLIGILSILELISFIAAIVFALIARYGCAVGGIIDVGWFGLLLAIAWWVGSAMGCRLEETN